MVPTQTLSDPVTDRVTVQRCSAIRDLLVRAGVFSALHPDETSRSGPSEAAEAHWRIATAPFALTSEQASELVTLGQDLLEFYRAVNRLYLDSCRGHQPTWVAEYLDQGKPESLITYSRMNRFRDSLPAVIRPDIIPTSGGMVITELDSVPGGIGLTACLSQAYADHERSEPSMTAASSHEASAMSHRSFDLVGGRDGIIQGFAAMLRSQHDTSAGRVAIVVSDESNDYRPEMRWLATQLQDIGLDAHCVDPRQLRFAEDGLSLDVQGRSRPVGLIYRFYELFDLMNVPKSELVMYAVKKGRVAVTPPYKPALEEKSAFALFHHPALEPFWAGFLGKHRFEKLRGWMPRTWILDPRPVPPSATIPGLSLAGRAISDFRALATATQKERRFVVKPSGFSELAWGSRGVSVGHDLSQTVWASALNQALAAFSTTPYVLQEFHKGRLYECSYVDPTAGKVLVMQGRVRLSPYYFVTGAKAELGGVLATVCPADKKILHGMTDAILAPCTVTPQGARSPEC